MLPKIVVSYAVGLGIEVTVAQWKKEEVHEGFFVTGILIPLIVPVNCPLWILLKSQKTKNPLNLDYKLKDILVLSTSSIAGGTLFGMHKQHKHTKKTKLKEGVFQILNATLPALGVSGMLKLCEKQKINNTPCKI